MHKLDETNLVLASNSVTVDFHMFDTLMENKVCSYIVADLLSLETLAVVCTSMFKIIKSC